MSLKTAKNYYNAEILQVAEAVAREMGFAKEIVVNVLEEVLKSIAKRKYGKSDFLRVKIDRKTGEVKIQNKLIVVSDEDQNLIDRGQQVSIHVNEPDEEDAERQPSTIALSEAKMHDQSAEIGEYLYEPLPPIQYNGSDVVHTKSLLISKLKEVERDKEYEEFKDMVGDIVHGVVDKVEYGNVIIKFRGAFGMIRRRDLLRSDNFKQGDKVKAYFVAIDKNNRGPQIILSRTHDDFIALLLAHEVPEIEEGIIQIKSVIQDPGSRAKIAVHTADPSIDPVGSCIGVKACRIQPISDELNGAKIDVVLWSEDLAQFTINALMPVQVHKLIIEEERKKIEVIVSAEQQSAAIGRQGQNIRLVSRLVGYNVSIITDVQEADRRKIETDAAIENFMKCLDVDNMLASLLYYQGYASVNELADSEIEALTKVVLDEATAEELITRARDYILNLQNTKNNAGSGSINAATMDGLNTENAQEKFALNNQNTNKLKIKKLHTNDPKMLNSVMTVLANQGVRSIQDLADLASDELSEILEKQNIEISSSEADKIIMQAREMTHFRNKK